MRFNFFNYLIVKNKKINKFQCWLIFMEIETQREYVE